MDFVKKTIKKTKEYLTGVSAEAKRVTWPGRRELWESTLVVISFIFILAATTLVCDKAIEGFIRIVHAGA
jgi:preprotein translocase subunit SecE